MRIVPDSAPPPVGLEEVCRLYHLGLFNQAWGAMEALGGAARMDGPDRGVLASRLLSQLGFRRRSREILLRLWRRHAAHPAVRHHFLWHLLELRGPVHTRDFLLTHPPPEEYGALHHADHLLQEAEVLARLRDFPRAIERVDEAAALAPDLRWLPVARGRILALMDRHGEALDNARTAALLDPGCWHLAAEEAEALIALGRDEEALRNLRLHGRAFEAPTLLLQWINLEIELEHWGHAWEALDRLESVLPAPVGADPGEEGFTRWIASRRADVCWMRGDAAGAAEWAGRAGDAGSFHGKFAARLASPPAGARRVVLPVGFTRQQHMTCAPATLATLCRYWGRPAEHLDIADAICFDGTSGHSERSWAEARGWIVREFTVTPVSARALIDRGIPFTLSSVEPGNAHAQAVIGYDDHRGTLLIRDPFERAKNEWIEEAAFKAQAPGGPRGMVLVPEGEASRLDGIPVWDGAAYDLMHALDRALDRHDRAAAREAADRLTTEHPDHRLACLARQAVAAYDQNPAAAVAALDVQLARHPDDVNAALRRHAWRASDAPRETRLAEWRATLKSPASHPLLWIEYAREISDDGRRRAEAQRWLRRASRRVVRGTAVKLRAELTWDSGRFDEAVEWLRIASCLDEFDEGTALAYFRCARLRGRVEEALAWLRLRAERHGIRGSAPAQTLARALAELDRQEESLAILEEGIRRRPDDVAHRVHSADALCHAGRAARAREMLESGPAGARAPAWHAAMAALEEREGGPAAALPHWEEASRGAPLDIPLLDGVLRNVEAAAGRDAALARLRERAGRFPHYRPLQRFAAEWILRVSSRQQEEFLERYLLAEPDDAWAWREIAFAHARQGRGAAARAAAGRAGEIEPRHPAVPVALAEADLLEGDRPAAMERIRAALRESIDYTYALRLLLANSHDAAARKEALGFMRAEIIRQHTSGEALQLFADLAAAHLPWEEILDLLREARAARPDLWRTGDSLAGHLARMGRLDEALTVAREVVAAFPLVHDPRVTLVSLLHNSGRRDEERAAIADALAVDASWAWFHRQRAQLLEEEGDAAGAAAVLDPLLARTPLDAFARHSRGRLAWKLGDRSDAIARLTALVRDEPGLDEAWQVLGWMGRESGDPALAARIARELVERRPDEARSWLVLAARLGGPADTDERIRAFDRALALNPGLVRAVEEKSLLLCEAGRIEEALALVRDPRWGSPRPPILRTREAWILGRLGRTPEALQLAEEALRDDPTLYQARLWVMDWCREDVRDTDALAHAEELTRQYPNDADAWCVLGTQRARSDSARKESKPAFEHALMLAPNSRRAYAHLHDLFLAAGDLAGAGRLLAEFEPHLDPIALAGFRMEIALHGNDLRDLLKQVRSLLGSGGDEPVWFQILLQHLSGGRSHWAAKVFDLVVGMLRGREARSPDSAVFAMELRPKKILKIWRILDGFAEGDEIARRGYATAFQRIAAAPGSHDDMVRWLRARKIRRLVQRRRGWFKTDTLIWAQIGYAFVVLGKNKEAAAWMSDWHDHPGVEPWMVNNLIVAQLSVADQDGARRNVLAALQLPYFDGNIMRFHLLESIWSALEGKEAESKQHLNSVNRKTLEAGFNTALLQFSEWLQGFAFEAPGTVPIQQGEKDRWVNARTKLGKYPVLRKNIAAARALRRKTAGQKSWAGGETIYSNDILSPRSWIAVFILVATLLRGCSELMKMSDPPRRRTSSEDVEDRPALWQDAKTDPSFLTLSPVLQERKVKAAIFTNEFLNLQNEL